MSKSKQKEVLEKKRKLNLWHFKVKQRHEILHERQQPSLGAQNWDWNTLVAEMAEGAQKWDWNKLSMPITMYRIHLQRSGIKAIGNYIPKDAKAKLTLKTVN